MSKAKSLAISFVTLLVVWLSLFVVSVTGSNIQGDVVFGGSNLVTKGKIPFIGARGTLKQPSSNFVWDETNSRLGIRVAAPSQALEVDSVIQVSGSNGGFLMNRRDTNALAWMFFSTAGELSTYDVVNGSVPVKYLPGTAGNEKVLLTLNGGTVLVAGATWDSSSKLEVLGSMSSDGSNAGYKMQRRDTSMDAWQIRSASGALGFYNYNLGAESLVVGLTGALQLPQYGAGTLTTDASGNVTATSDEHLKYIQRPFTGGLREISELRPIVYKWRPESKLDTKHEYAGFSAQQVKQFIPEAVGQDQMGHMTLQDRPIEAALVNAVRELSEQVTILQKRVIELENK